jgi:hypothetical protein
MLAGSALAAGLSGCSGSGDAPKNATLNAGAFRDADGAVPPLKTAPVKTVTQKEAAAGFLDLTSLPGAPTVDAPGATPVGEQVIVDQFIGQINGRALMASEFFGEGFGERLRAMGQDAKYVKDPSLWRKEAAEAIYLRLIRKVKDGLLLDEIYSAMTPEVRQQGLRFFMDQIRKEYAGRAQGSAMLADEKLRETEGKTFDEVLAEVRDDELMRMHLRDKVGPRVNISWQQIINEYERRYEATRDTHFAQFIAVRVDADDAKASGQVSGELARGGDLAEIAKADVNTFKSDEGGLLPMVRFKGDRAKASLIALAPLNEAAQKMNVGEVAGPIKAGSSLWWIKLQSLESPDLKTLYEAQIEILEELRNRKSAQEEQLYIQRLMERSSHTPLSQMVERLYKIAAERYAPTDTKN